MARGMTTRRRGALALWATATASCLWLGAGAGCLRTLTGSEFMALRGEVEDRNEANYHAAREALVAQGFVLGEETATRYLGAHPSLRHDLLTRCLDARRTEDVPPLPLVLYELAESRHQPREEVTAPAHPACQFLDGSHGSLTVTLPDGSTRDLQRLDARRWQTATSPSGERFRLQPSPRGAQVRTVRVSCEDRTPELRQTPLSTGEQVPFRYREEAPLKELRMDYDVEHLEDVCG